jgi:acetylornithine deacetylase/succinyl-diaminopimelate desuccinylase-like protein
LLILLTTVEQEGDMKELLMKKTGGMRRPLAEFSRRVTDFNLDGGNLSEFTDKLAAEMLNLGFDKASKDKSGNLVGVIKGYSAGEDMVLVSHLDYATGMQAAPRDFIKSGLIKFKAGIISGIYAAALLKRAMLPLSGDLFVCCVPRLECSDFGIKFLFENYLKSRLEKIKGVVLCEPTDFNVCLGHKGRMEYEIVVKGRLNRDFLENRGMNMLGTMFPLIHELEKVSLDLPSDFSLGRSNLRIKDVRYGGYEPKEELNEFRVVVDRVFIPEEESANILNRAKTIARNVYRGDSEVSVSTMVAKERVKTYTGMDLVAVKEFRPWTMESHHPFALGALECLKDARIKSGFGYWKKIFTEGSYTYGGLKIPTIGFGAGSEDDIDSGAEALSMDKLERAVFGQALIAQRTIGIPSFGWSSDDV